MHKAEAIKEGRTYQLVRTLGVGDRAEEVIRERILVVRKFTQLITHRPERWALVILYKMQPRKSRKLVGPLPRTVLPD